MANTEKQFLDEEGLDIVRNNTFIPVFDTWAEYEEAKNTIPEGMKFIVREDENDSYGIVNSIILSDQVTGALYNLSIQNGQISVQPIVGDRGPN